MLLMALIMPSCINAAVSVDINAGWCNSADLGNPQASLVDIQSVQINSGLRTSCAST